VKLYPDSAHGFLFQNHAAFAGDVDRFLTANSVGATRARRP
jgi:hypothetical protein